VMDAIHQAWEMAESQASDTSRPTPPRMDRISGDFIAKG